MCGTAAISMGIFSSFKKLEKKARTSLSHHPIVYAVIGSFGVVLFWRGIWHTTDFISTIVLAWQGGSPTVDLNQVWDGLLSGAIGFSLLLSTGLFVSDFIGSEIISTALKEEEKMTGKTESEVKTELQRITQIEKKMAEVSEHIDQHLERIEKKLKE